MVASITCGRVYPSLGRISELLVMSRARAKPKEVRRLVEVLEE